MKNKEKTYYFLKSNDFELIQKDTSDFFGDYYDIFSNGSFQLRFSSSRAFETIEIRRNLPNESWYDLVLVKALLHEGVNLSNVTTIEEYMDFLQDDLANIAELFSEKNYPATKRRLEDLESERASQMFPGIRK